MCVYVCMCVCMVKISKIEGIAYIPYPKPATGNRLRHASGLVSINGILRLDSHH